MTNTSTPPLTERLTQKQAEQVEQIDQVLSANLTQLEKSLKRHTNAAHSIIDENMAALQHAIREYRIRPLDLPPDSDPPGRAGHPERLDTAGLPDNQTGADPATAPPDPQGPRPGGDTTRSQGRDPVPGAARGRKKNPTYSKRRPAAGS